jgi:BirA family transcriptional regulator, biotin operon repressor / biotin---[acetyl-CoA-carboxylase] ligase
VSALDLQRLRQAFPLREIEHYETIDSTMRAAAGRALGTVILAEEQTAGQGRYGRSWHSEARSGLYLSVVLRPARLLTMALGLATVEAITSSTGIACDLCWPNDVMVGGRKVAGILVQLSIAQLSDGAAIGGIGINVNQSAFPRELAERATSLRIHAGREFSRMDMLQALIPAVERFRELTDDTILRLFTEASSYARGRRVVVDQPDGIIEGVTAGLTDAGYLRVRQDDGTDMLIVAGGVRAAGA